MIEIDWGKYVSNDEKRQYFCRDCGSLIMEGRIARTLRLDAMPEAGCGDVHNCKPPFCPKCEPEREFQYGEPLLYSELKDHICPMMPAAHDEEGRR